MTQIRPEDCPNPDGCEPILSGFDRICFGRLTEKQPDPDPEPGVGILYNTHCWCLDAEPLQLNDEDAYLFLKGFKAIRQDVEAQGSYRPPGYKDTWDFVKEK
jgi:hypothetical protein